MTPGPAIPLVPHAAQISQSVLSTTFTKVNSAIQTALPYVISGCRITYTKVQYVWTISQPFIIKGIEFLQTKLGASILCITGSIGYLQLSKKMDNRALALATFILGLTGLGVGIYMFLSSGTSISARTTTVLH